LAALREIGFSGRRSADAEGSFQTRRSCQVCLAAVERVEVRQIERQRSSDVENIECPIAERRGMATAQS